MKKVNYKFEYIDERLYNICDVIENFSFYFGLSLEQMEELFQNYNMLSRECFNESMELYLKENSKEGDSSRNVHYRAMVEYKCLTGILNILSKRGLEYLLLLNYLKRLDDKLEKKEVRLEEQLEGLGIFHYHSVMIGIDIKRILIALGNTLKYFELNLNKLNDYHVFYQKVVSSCSFSGGTKFYGQGYIDTCIASREERFADKTSISIQKSGSKKRKKSINY